MSPEQARGKAVDRRADINHEVDMSVAVQIADRERVRGDCAVGDLNLRREGDVLLADRDFDSTFLIDGREIEDAVAVQVNPSPSSRLARM